MRIVCTCGHENTTLMPFEDTHIEHIACTNACRTARQLRVEMSIRPLSEKLSDAFPNVHLGLPPTGLLGQ